MKDEDVVYKMGPSVLSPDGKIVELDDEGVKKAPEAEGSPSKEEEPVGDSSEGLRKRATDATKNEQDS